MFGWFKKKKEEEKPIYQDVLDHLRDGKKVYAIKAYRAHTGLGLKESKAFIDHLAETM